MSSETEKHRHLAERYCTGNGVDLGSAGDPIVPHAIQVDLPQAIYKRYNQTRPVAVIHWRGSALDLPFYNETLDFVHSSHLLEDFEDWKLPLHEWARVLKPDGCLIIAVPDHERFRAYVKRGKDEGIDRDNLSHKHESHRGEIAGRFPDWKVLFDNFVNDDPLEYSLLTVLRKP